MKFWLPAMGMFVSLSGCAGYQIKLDGTKAGYDVYRPEPYVLLSPKLNNTGEVTGYDGAIVWLPDYGTRYRIHTWNLLGKADFDFKFRDGWMLTGLTDKSDNTELAKALIQSATTLAAQAKESVTTKALETEDGKVKDDKKEYQPILFKIIFDGTGRAVRLAELESGENVPAHNPPPPGGACSTPR